MAIGVTYCRKRESGKFLDRKSARKVYSVTCNMGFCNVRVRERVPQFFKMVSLLFILMICPIVNI